MYVGAGAATVGSSNFSTRGLGAQTEANVRFDRSTDPARYAEATQLAENLWTVGTDWGPGFTAVLRALLVEVGWREALARAVADLLRGDWAAEYVLSLERRRRNYFPAGMDVSVSGAMGEPDRAVRQAWAQRKGRVS